MSFVMVPNGGKKGSVAKCDLSIRVSEKITGRLSLAVMIPAALIADLKWTLAETRVSILFGLGEDHGVIKLSADVNGCLLSKGKSTSGRAIVQKEISTVPGIKFTSGAFLQSTCSWEVENSELFLFPKNITYVQTKKSRASA